VAEFSVGSPTLDEVFFALTGRPAEAQRKTKAKARKPRATKEVKA